MVYFNHFLLEMRKKTGRKKRKFKTANKKDFRGLEKIGRWLDRQNIK